MQFVADRSRESNDSSKLEGLDVLIVGAGFCGVYLLDQLRKKNFKAQIYEGGADLGGVWHWNCYPGARVDSSCWIYQLSDEELWSDWQWTELYPGYKEVRAYFKHLDKKLNLSRDVRFNTWVREANFDEDRHEWEIKAKRNDGSNVVVCTKHFIMCTGSSSKPFIPEIEGLDSFSGESSHTAFWPQGGIDFKGKHVGVIGTGASGVQVIQEASKEAAKLTVFQRTPNLCLPMGQKQLGDEDNREGKLANSEVLRNRLSTWGGIDYDIDERLAKNFSEEERDAHFEELWNGGGFRFWIGNFADMLMDEEVNRAAYDFWRNKVRGRIASPEMAEKLAPENPPHPFGTKRVSLEQWYFEVFNQENVDLVDIKETPIERITSNGVKIGNELVYLDVLVMATGFDAVTGGLTQIDIRDKDGKTLEEKWANGVRVYQGLSNHGYPNMFATYGPQAPTAFVNGPTCAEMQGDFIVDALVYLRDNGYTRMEPTAEAEESWRNLCIELAEPTLFSKADSWYMAANIPGKAREMLMYAGGVPAYIEILRDCANKGYEGYRIG